MKRSFSIVTLSCFLILLSSYAAANEQEQNYWLEDHTSPEIQEKIENNSDTIFIPTAGIEQNGVLGTLKKHHHVLRYTMPQIAASYKNALIAPIIDFVPEGDIPSKEGHMAFAGTISMPSDLFRSIISHTVYSLAAHGFKKFYLFGDSGGNQKDQMIVAEKLRQKGYHVYAISDYYANKKQNEYLENKYDLDMKQIGTHMGMRDTSELLYAYPNAVRTDNIVDNTTNNFYDVGANGNALLASSDIGKALLDIKIDLSLKQIKTIETQPFIKEDNISRWDLLKKYFLTK